MVIWLVGLSGAGKTTIGRQLYKQWKKQASNTALLDGDHARYMLKHDTDPADYSLAGRRANALRIVAMCSWLDDQDINVVCCILCIFDDIMKANSERFSRYFQVFLDAPLPLLKKRDPKGIYARAACGEEKNVVGIDIPFSQPSSSDLIIPMMSSSASPSKMAQYIISSAGVAS